jgi:hypothetical protein
MKRKAEYKEGQEARENFETLAKALFQAPKIEALKKKRQAGKPTSPKKSGKSGS